MKNVREMSDEELSDELRRLTEREQELKAEKVRRIISLDGDIGRRYPRAPLGDWWNTSGAD
jgi:hypothetical protein